MTGNNKPVFDSKYHKETRLPDGRNRPLRERQRIAKLIPWVQYRTEPGPCRALRSNVSLEAVFTGAEPRPQNRCTRKAFWHFTAARNSGAKTGLFCWDHLLSRGLYFDEFEYRRSKRWMDKYLIHEAEQETAQNAAQNAAQEAAQEAVQGAKQQATSPDTPPPDTPPPGTPPSDAGA